MHNDDVCSLMNPFSKTSLKLPKLAKVWKRKILFPDYEYNPIFYKLVVPSPLALITPCSLVAAMIMDEGNCGTLCISQPPITIDSFRDDKHPVRHLGDVAFFDGKLYVLGGFDGLFIIELDEIDLLTKPARWKRASNLGGHALFLGQHSSKSLPAKECSGYHEDCIYFICDYPWPKYSANPLRDCGVYNMRDGTFKPLMSGSAAVPPRHAGQWRPTWFFPPELV
uniref:Uncharacterized protein n=1 Tax=Avena sativa TaxID=4498 RepID=A0ACD5ZJN6_AVESA